jgi:hypothetical protein
VLFYYPPAATCLFISSPLFFPTISSCYLLSIRSKYSQLSVHQQPTMLPKGSWLQYTSNVAVVLWRRTVSTPTHISTVLRIMLLASSGLPTYQGYLTLSQSRRTTSTHSQHQNLKCHTEIIQFSVFLIFRFSTVNKKYSELNSECNLPLTPWSDLLLSFPYIYIYIYIYISELLRYFCMVLCS